MLTFDKTECESILLLLSFMFTIFVHLICNFLNLLLTWCTFIGIIMSYIVIIYVLKNGVN